MRTHLGEYITTRRSHSLWMPSQAVSHAKILDWFRTQLPGQDEERDRLLYHSPLPPYRDYNPKLFTASTVILSLTPTDGVYKHLHSDPRSKKVVFLHRPWSLDRMRVPHGTLILQSHLKFDEMYTTGYNLAFGLKHNVALETVKCISGYKGDPNRSIGLLGELHTATRLQDYLANTIDDFHGCELQQVNPEQESIVQAIASLNAFDEDVVQRVLDGLANVPPERILCITGAAREAGLIAAQKGGMQVLCVGHRRCELWGIRYLAAKLSRDLNLSDVRIVDEPDVVVERTRQQVPESVPESAPAAGSNVETV